MTSTSTPSSQPAAAGVSAARLARLTRGINLSHWFAQSRTYEQERLHSFMTVEDFKLIRSLGFAHVRLTLEPEILLNRDEPARLNARYLRLVDEALDMMLGQELAVIVDLHPEDRFKHQLEQSDAAVAQFVTFWQALAGHLSARDPERLFLEVLNEPVMRDGTRWSAIQARALAAMRAGAPAHTLIATAHMWSSLPQLLELEPVADRNVVYTFHCYDPHTFTHQGASWGSDYWPYLAYLPYPASPELVEQAIAGVEHEEARQAALQYGAERWSYERMQAWLAQAAQWAERHNVPLTCNEFGVYRRKSHPEHRNAWIHDVRVCLEQYNIGWAMWDYGHGFGVVTGEPGQRSVDRDTAAALGLL